MSGVYCTASVTFRRGCRNPKVSEPVQLTGIKKAIRLDGLFAFLRPKESDQLLDLLFFAGVDSALPG